MSDISVLPNINTNISNILSQITHQTEQLLLLLSQKERYVLEKRFGLENKGQITLEAIGKHFHVTRERVRQIEKNALQKLRRNIEHNPLFSINDFVFKLLQESGGLMLQDILLSKIISNEEMTVPAIVLVISLDNRFERLSNTIEYHPYVKLKTISNENLKDITDKTVQLLNGKKEVMSVKEIAIELRKLMPENNLIEESFLSSLARISKKLKFIDEGIGLMLWRHINPKTLRDKIFFIFRKQPKPLHFIDIANKITQAGFDHKKINLQAVHNELIRCEDFVLIGRGIYALKEWGYRSGTVAEIIKAILKKKGPIEQDQIIEEVLKQRQVKAITIIMNLKNSSAFTRVGRRRYALNNND